METRLFESQIIGDCWTSPDLWANLTYLCDACEGRFAGTADERKAGDFLLNRLAAYGLDNCHAEPFEMPGWQRGESKLILHSGDHAADLPCIALPGSPACHLDIELVDVGQGRPEDYQRLGAPAAGKAVLTSADGPGRGEKFRAALEAGAAAFIFSGGQPGMLAPTGSVPKDLPSIGVSSEHAARLRRALSAGKARIELTLTCSIQPAIARSIVAEIPGSDPAQGWLVACGHYDGHDIAQGAGDNAAGTAVLLEAARLLSPLRASLKAGIRFVFFSGEELGLYGSYAYARDHAAELDALHTVVNVDVVGLAMPLVLMIQSSPELAGYLRQLPCEDLDIAVKDGPGSFIMNSDHFAFSLAGIPAVWAVTSAPAPASGGWGHTSADTLDKLEPRMVRMTAASLTRLLLRMSRDAGSRLPRVHKTAERVKE